MDSPNILVRDYPVRFYEVDPEARLKPVTLLNYLQDAASEHTVRLGVSIGELQAKGVTWVLSRCRVRFVSHAKSGDTVRIRTWPAARDRLFSMRDFEVTDQGNNRLALATSAWALVDLASGRPLRLDRVLPDYPLHDERVLEPAEKTLPELVEAETEIPFQVRRADHDINRHVNNTVYAEWALEAVPGEIASSCQLSDLEIAYRSPAYSGERVLSRIARQHGPSTATFVHQLAGEKDGRELARLRTVWQPLP